MIDGEFLVSSLNFNISDCRMIKIIIIIEFIYSYSYLLTSSHDQRGVVAPSIFLGR